MNEIDPKDARKINEEDAAAVAGGTDLMPETEGIPDVEVPWAKDTTPSIYTIYVPELRPDYEIEYPSGLKPKDEFNEFDIPY